MAKGGNAPPQQRSEDKDLYKICVCSMHTYRNISCNNYLDIIIAINISNCEDWLTYNSSYCTISGSLSKQNLDLNIISFIEKEKEIHLIVA